MIPDAYHWWTHGTGGGARQYGRVTLLRPSSTLKFGALTGRCVGYMLTYFTVRTVHLPN